MRLATISLNQRAFRRTDLLSMFVYGFGLSHAAFVRTNAMRALSDYFQILRQEHHVFLFLTLDL